MMSCFFNKISTQYPLRDDQAESACMAGLVTQAERKITVQVI